MLSRPFIILWKICLFALLGVGVIILAGPIIVLLVFCAMGLGVYLLIKAVGGRKAAKAVEGIADSTRHVAYRSASWTVASVNRGIGSVVQRWRHRRAVTPSVAREAGRGKWTYAGKIILEAACGAAVAVLLAGVLFTHTGQRGEQLADSLVISAVAGGIIGLLVGLSRTRYTSKSSPESL